MSSCCSSSQRPPRWRRRIGEGLAWVGSGTLFALIPKCPMCVAAYVALWTGVSIPLAAATWLRWGLLGLCAASLTVLLLKHRNRFFALYGYLTKETRP